MDDALIERAVAPLRTLASEWRERAVTDGRLQGGDPWWRGHAVSKKDDATELEQAIERLTAALAEVEASIKAQALREYADAHRHPWTVFLCADGSPVTVNDLMRETADRLEAGGGAQHQKPSEVEALLRATVAGVAMVAEEWSGYGHGKFNIHPDVDVANSCELCKIVRQISEALRGEGQP